MQEIIMTMRISSPPAHAQAIAFLLLFSVLPVFAAEQPKDQLSLQDRAYIASRIYSSLSYFAHWQNVPQFDLEKSYRAYLEKALSNSDRTAFTHASMEFLAGLHNGHTVFIDMPLVQQGGQPPFVAELVDGQWLVTQSASQEVNPGDVIKQIDGRNFGEFVTETTRLVSGSTTTGAQHTLFARMPDFAPYAHLFPRKFTLTLAGDRKVTVDHDTLLPAQRLTVEGRWLREGKVAYIRIPSFMAQGQEKRALELAHEYKQSEVLVVDLRGNQGGRTPAELAAYLMDRPFQRWVESVPVEIPFFRMRAEQGHEDYQPFIRAALDWSNSTQQPPQEHYSGKLILLVDSGCLSACEDFAMPFKMNHRAQLVGETTGGSSGQPFQLDLGQGMMALIGAKRESFPDGSQFEGIGIKPDIEVSPKVEDLRSGRDTALEVALRRLLP
jgi:carboxyl-terminal processing protease